LIKGDMGKVTGEASPNSLVNLYAARVLDRSYAEKVPMEAPVSMHT